MTWIEFGGYALIVSLALFIGIVLALYLLQDHMIFLGEKLPPGHRYSFHEKFVEFDVELPNSLLINCLLFKCDQPKGLVYYHHGNAGNLQGWGKYAEFFTSLGYDVLFYDYRGYGKSQGSIKREHHLHDDAQFILDRVKEMNDYPRFIYYGNSLGTGVATKLAELQEPELLILESPYYSFPKLVHYHYPFLPAGVMLKYKLRTNKVIPKLTCPILIFHGTDDEIVPYDQGLNLSKLRKEVKLVTIESGVHNNLVDFKLYQQELKKEVENLSNSPS